MKVRIKRSKAGFLQEIVEKYRASGQPWPTTMAEIAAWAIQNKLWQPERRSLLKQCAKELATALRVEYYTDPQGRRVRKKHAYKETITNDEGEEKQLTLWVDILDADPKQIKVAFAQRRQSIYCDCKQLKTDADSYNDNNVHGAQLELDFDFNEDLAEDSLPTEYPSGPQGEE